MNFGPTQSTELCIEQNLFDMTPETLDWTNAKNVIVAPDKIEPFKAKSIPLADSLRSDLWSSVRVFGEKLNQTFIIKDWSWVKIGEKHLLVPNHIIKDTKQ